MVEIHTRDINGTSSVMTLRWGDIYNHINTHINDLEEEEILLVVYEGTCIYSQLGNEPIDWEDILGFFA